MTETSWIRSSTATALTCTTTRYTVLERQGRGGTATVHRAIEHGADGWQREVALKRLFPHLAEDDGFVRCFVREADMASRLEHPNIVKIHRLGRGATGYFISMELVAGRDLRRVMARASKRRMTPPLGVVLSLLWELCDALDYAHGRGVIHRDVSPCNLIVRRDGHLVVIDFGIARATASDDATRVGLTQGKYAYMSPEASRGEELDPRSDIFSVGVIAHELLTMEPLFAGRSDLETVARVRSARVRAPSEHNREVPPELDAIVLTALERDRSDRFESARAMREALTAVRLRHGWGEIATGAPWVDRLFELARGSSVGPGPV